MKRIISIVLLTAVSIVAFAQRAPQSASYKDLKGIYSPKNYVKSDADAYSTFWIGLESLGAPGTGQLIMKETGRGWAFLGASAVLGAAGSIIYQDKIFPLIEISDGEWTIPEANKDKVNSYLAILGGLAMADLGIHIWSCIDAVRIAKVKNQYFQDKRGKHAFSADIHPSVNMVQNGNGVTPTAGMTLAVKF